MLPPGAILLFSALVQDGTTPSPSAPSRPAAEAQVVEGPTVARFPESFLHVRIDLSGMTTYDRNSLIRIRAYGRAGVVVGTLPELNASIEVLAYKGLGKAATNEAWRDENLSGSGIRWDLFDAADMACGEVSVMLDGSGSHDFHAFAVRGGYRVDIHLGESLQDEVPPRVDRARFAEILETVRMAVVRRGTWDQLPPEAIELMDDALRHPEGWRERFAERRKEHPDDYAIPFAEAELLLHLESPPEERIAACAQAIEILESMRKDGETLPARETLALAASLDGAGIARIDAGESAKAVPSFQKALETARDLTAPIRAGILYNLACAYAQLGDVEKTIETLEASEAQDSGAFRNARIDTDFDPIRESKRFQAVLDGNHGLR